MLTPALDNSSEFYPHHYLDEVLASDLDGIRAEWRERGSAAPPQRLAALGGAYHRLRGLAEEGDDTEALHEAVADFHARILEALGYTRRPETHLVEQTAGGDWQLPVLARLCLPSTSTPHLLCCGDGIALPAPDGEREGDAGSDPLALPVRGATQGNQPLDLRWEAACDAIFAAEDRPRFVLYLAGAHILLLEAHKWAQGRFLRIDLDLAGSYTWSENTVDSDGAFCQPGQSAKVGCAGTYETRTWWV